MGESGLDTEEVPYRVTRVDFRDQSKGGGHHTDEKYKRSNQNSYKKACNRGGAPEKCKGNEQSSGGRHSQCVWHGKMDHYFLYWAHFVARHYGETEERSWGMGAEK